MPEQRTPSTKTVSQKLLLKPGLRTLVLNAPPNYLSQLPTDVQFEQRLDGSFDFIQLFVTRRDELRTEGPKLRQALKPNGLLWVSYPKGKAIPTDLNRDVVRLTLAGLGLEVVSQVAIDDTWSALRAKVV